MIVPVASCVRFMSDIKLLGMWWYVRRPVASIVQNGLGTSQCIIEELYAFEPLVACTEDCVLSHEILSLREVSPCRSDKDSHAGAKPHLSLLGKPTHPSTHGFFISAPRTEFKLQTTLRKMHKNAREVSTSRLRGRASP